MRFYDSPFRVQAWFEDLPAGTIKSIPFEHTVRDDDGPGRDGDQENSTCPNVWWALALRSLSQDVSILFLRLALDAHQGRLACHPAVLMFAALFPFGLVL